MLSNAYFLAKFRFDTAENEPAKNLQKFAKFANFADPNPVTLRGGRGRRGAVLGLRGREPLRLRGGGRLPAALRLRRRRRDHRGVDAYVYSKPKLERIFSQKILILGS